MGRRHDRALASQLSTNVLAHLRLSASHDVRGRLAIGAELADNTAELRHVARAVGVGERALRHCIEVRRRMSDAEVELYLSLPRPPPWSALVAVSGVTSRSTRERLLREWLSSPGDGVRSLARRVRAL